MPVSTFFNNYNSVAEQSLIEDLIIESIRQYGIDILYLPSSTTTEDTLYGESRIKRYTSVFPVEMYIKNVDSFGGDGDFLSKFNITISDTMTLTVARKVFERNVVTYTTLVRPREGDLLYFPLNQKVFEVKFVEHEPVFYQMGSLQMYDLKVELFEYNNQIFSTGVAVIDNIYSNYSLDNSVNDDISDADPVEDNTQLQLESDVILDFNDQDPFAEGNY